jgi:hypothetical protein
MLATKSDIAKIGDDMLNLSTAHAIIEQHFVDTKSKIFYHKIIVLIVLVIKKSCVTVTTRIFPKTKNTNIQKISIIV